MKEICSEQSVIFGGCLCEDIQIYEKKSKALETSSEDYRSNIYSVPVLDVIVLCGQDDLFRLLRERNSG